MSDNSELMKRMVANSATELEEIVEVVPGVKQSGPSYDSEDLNLLAAKIAALSSGKAILRRRRMNNNEISRIRHVLETFYNYKLITRTRPGETYFWRGDKIDRSGVPENVIMTKLERKPK